MAILALATNATTPLEKSGVVDVCLDLVAEARSPLGAMFGAYRLTSDGRL